MKKYIAPSYENMEAESKDIITASITDNGEASYTYGGNTVKGQKGTFSGLFSDIFNM